MNVRDLLGRGSDRPPAPEVASAEDVERYNLEYLQHNPVEADTGTGHDDPTMDLPFAKQLDDDTVNRTQYPWLYEPERGVRWDFDPVQLRNLGQTNTWVGMLVQSITKEVSETPWTITTIDNRTERRKRQSTHPESRTPIQKEYPDATAERIGDLLEAPNPDHNWNDYIEMALADLLEVGSASTVKAFPRRAYDGAGEDATFTADPEAIEPRALMPSAPEVWTKDYRGKTGLLEGFWQFDRERAPGTGSSEGGTTGSRGFRTPIHFVEDEVMWTDMSPRTNRRYGMPPTLLVQDFLQSLDLAVTQEQQYLSRGSIPSGAWVFEQWDREEVKEWKTENAENLKGKPHKSLMFAGRGGDVRFEPMSMNFKELEFTDRMQWYARVISSVFQVPTAVVGIEPEQINYATFQGERENFEENTLGPYLQKLERYINGSLIDPHWPNEYHFEFKPGVSESTRQMIADRVTSEWNANLITRDEARQELGREPAEQMEGVDSEDGFKTDLVNEPAPEDAGGALDSLVASELSKDSEETEKQTFDDYPEAASENAQMALDARDDTDNPNDCGTDTGWARANQLANGEAISRETVGRMAAFDRHRQNSEMSDDEGRADCGWMMWNAWGGDEGVDWAIDKLDELEEQASSAGDSGNANESVRKGESLRNTDEWYQFDVQPEMVDDLQADIADDVRELYDAVLSDDEILALIERLAADDEQGGEMEKSASALARRLRDVLSQTRIAGDIADAIRTHTADAVREALDNAVESVDDPDAEAVDVEAVTSRLEDRDVAFADRFADQMADEIRETVGDGWAEGKNSREIAQDIAEQGDLNEGWNGAERIARQELQIATGEARSEVAADMGKVEVWETAGDDRVRQAHSEMDGLWKYPADAWQVDYSDRGRGIQNESVPGDSEPGIGCRCVTLLRDREDVDSENYGGDSGP